jgi:hypothetical protein
MNKLGLALKITGRNKNNYLIFIVALTIATTIK